VTIGFVGLAASFGLFCVSDKVKKKFDHGIYDLIKVWFNWNQINTTLLGDK